MFNYIFHSHSENDTLNFAKYVASKLNNKDILVLSGDLGSGKTKFTRRHFIIFWFRK